MIFRRKSFIISHLLNGDLLHYFSDAMSCAYITDPFSVDSACGNWGAKEADRY